MAIRPIVLMGDPRIFSVAERVTENEFNTQELNDLIKDMEDTMVDSNGVGLAAPQIGVSKRLVIFGCQRSLRYPDAPEIPKTVLLNPTITALCDETNQQWEGCLSIPGMRGLVERPARIHYRGFDQLGNEIDREVDGFHACVVQHECDHLDGILYPMRIKDLRNFGFEKALT